MASPRFTDELADDVDRVGQSDVEGDERDRLIAGATLLVPATLAERLGLRELFEEHVDLGDARWWASVSHKAMTLIHSLLADGDSIDDSDALGHRHSARPRASPPSTLGTFLPSFSYDHAGQPDAVSREFLRRGFAARAGPGDGSITLDLDSTMWETYGLRKESSGRFRHVRRSHPLLAAIAWFRADVACYSQPACRLC